DAIYKVFHMPGRMQEGYFQADLLSDILGRGKSSRLYRQLVKEKSIFNSINAYVLGSADPGLLVIQGHVNQNTSIETAHDALSEIIQHLVEEGASEPELQKVKNKAEATLIFSGVEVLNQAIHLALNAALGNPDRVNQESALLQAVNNEEINASARNLLVPENSSTLFYRKRS
ncbi:MAG: insulinase family protein, partial [Bacteroidota bacterium]